MSKREVKQINIHLTQIGKLLGSSAFTREDLVNLEEYLSRALSVVRNTVDISDAGGLN